MAKASTPQKNRIGGTTVRDRRRRSVASIVAGITLGSGVAMVSGLSGLVPGLGNGASASPYLGGLTFLDLNRNGIYEAGSDRPVGGVTVVVTEASGATTSTQSNSTTGEWNVMISGAGPYRVEYSTFPNNTTESGGAGSALQFVAASPANLALYGSQDASNNLNPLIGNDFELGNRVWRDANNNGIQDANEAGIANVEVSLFQNGQPAMIAGNPVTPVRTNNAGEYYFAGLPANQNYDIQIAAGQAALAGLSPAQVGAGTAQTDSNGMTKSDGTVFAAATTGTSNHSYDFGFVTSASNPAPAPQLAEVGDRVWVDSNGNGIQDQGEAGLGNVLVELLNSSGDKVAEQRTNNDGLYLFSDVVPGEYSIRVVNPGGYTFAPTQVAGSTDANDSDVNATGRSRAVTLVKCDCNKNLDAGLVPIVSPGLASVGNRLWMDTNSNGTQDSGETGVIGATVRLVNAATGAIRTTLTGTDGLYLFADVAVGSYYIEFDAPTGYQFTSARSTTAGDEFDSDAESNGRTRTITLVASQTNLNMDAGVTVVTQPQLGGFGDRVWIDTNANGVQDANEVGLAGVVVQLFRTGTSDILATDTTDASGIYGFKNLVPGSYYVRFVLPAGYSFTTANSSLATEETDSDADTNGYTTPVVIGPCECNKTVDAGLIVVTSGKAALGDRVWIDANANGAQDSGEVGVSGVTVRLLDTNNNVLATTVTGVGGYYRFDNLNPGSYSVQFTLPSGYNFTTPLASGVSDVTNSDAAANGQTRSVTLAAGDVFLDLDAGLVTTGSSSTTTTVPGSSTTTTVPGSSTTTTVPGSSTTTTVPGSSTTTTVPGSSTTTTLFLGRLASLGDRVWIDANSNGIQDNGEVGLAGVTVNLLNANGTVISTMTTIADGRYTFFDLTPGTYSVQVVLPAGYRFTSTQSGGDDGLDSDVNVSGFTRTVTLIAGEFNPRLDAGLIVNTSVTTVVTPTTIVVVPTTTPATNTTVAPSTTVPVTVLGTVVTSVPGNATGCIVIKLFMDGGNGKDNGPIPGGTVNITLNDGTVLRASSAADGTVSFCNLRPGTYPVQVETGSLPPAAKNTFDTDGTPDNKTSVVLSGAEAKSAFGYQIPTVLPAVVDNPAIPLAYSGNNTNILLYGLALLLVGYGISELTRTRQYAKRLAA